MVRSATEKKLRKQTKTTQAKEVKITIRLSREAKKNLEFLRLKFLDKQGRKPSGSRVIERLLNAAVADGKIPYPVP